MTERGLPDQTIRVATFNMKHGAYADKYTGNPNKAAEACMSLGADILALQEVDKGTIRSGFKDLARLAAQASGMEVVFARTIKYKVGSYGNALLVRGKIGENSIYELGGGARFRKHILGRERTFGYEPRNAILASVQVGSRRVQIGATHLSTNKPKAKAQLAALADTMNYQETPQVLLGDFNLTYGEVLRMPQLAQFDMAAEIHTFPGENPIKMIDHIAVQGLTIVSAYAVRAPISDHQALVAEVE